MKKIILSSLAIMFAAAASMAQYKSFTPYSYYNAGADVGIGIGNTQYTDASAGGKIIINVDKSLNGGDKYGAVTLGVRNLSKAGVVNVISPTAANNRRAILSIKANPAATVGLQFQADTTGGHTANASSPSQSVGTTASALTFQYAATDYFKDIYSGGPCQPTSPCVVDSTKIGQILLTVAPGSNTYSGTITIDYIYVGDSTITYPLMGLAHGTTPILPTTGSYAVGSTTAGTASTPVTLTIANGGTGALTLTGATPVTVTGTDFVVTQPTSPVAASGTSTFTVGLSSTATAGNKTATLTIASNDIYHPSYTITVTGTVNASTATEVSQALSNSTVITPNPFSDNINVSLGNGFSGKVSANIRNTYGVTVSQVSNVDASGFNMTTSNLSSGVYFLEIVTNDGTTAIKRIVK